MNDKQRESILEALRHGSIEEPELEEILRDDLKALEPIIDEMIAEARDYYFVWTMHRFTCPAARGCTCGLTAAIENRRKL